MKELNNHPTNEQLQSYLDRDMDPPALLEVQNHLAECPDCQAAFDRLDKTLLRLKALPELELANDLSPMVIDQLKKEQAIPGGITWTLILEVLGAGAVIGLLIPALKAAAWTLRLQDIQNQIQAAINIFFTQIASSWLVWWAELQMEMDLLRDNVLSGTTAPVLDISPWILILAAGGIGILINIILLRARPVRGGNHNYH